MTWQQKWIAYQTILFKEVRRTFRVWIQTLITPIINTILYFLIFGTVIGRRVGQMDGHDYIKFIAPGLIMLSVINNSYSAAVSSFFSAKFMRSLEELLVSPVSSSLILTGYVSAGIARGLIVGSLVGTVAMLFTHLPIHSLLEVITVAILTSAIFSLGGIINALFATKFDDIAIIPTFVLTPLIYLGGVFYSLSLLPKFWYYLSLANPIAYIIHAFRVGFFGGSMQYLTFAYAMMMSFFMLLFAITWWMLKKGVGLRQ